MSTPFPDYAKSSHPDVLEALRETARRREEFFTKMRELSERLTGTAGNGYFTGWEQVSQRMTGISARVDVATLPGQWKKPDRGVRAPYRNNPLAAEIDAVTYKAADIPGRENLAIGGGRMGCGLVFEHDGVAYSHFGFTRGPMNERQAAEAEEYGWIEILASEFHLAMENENARRAATRELEAAK